MKGGLAWLLAVSATACSFGSEGVGNGQGLGQGDDDDDAPTTGSPMDDTGVDDGIPPTSGGDDDDDDDDDDSTADADDDDDDDDDSSSDGPSEPVCGNRMVEGDEACDDGNEVDHDGCTNACQDSGSQAWSLSLGNNPGVFETLRGVAYHSGEDSYFAAGFVYDDGSGYDALQVEISDPGNADYNMPVALSGNQFAASVAVDPDGALLVAGTDGNAMRVERFDTAWQFEDGWTFAGFGSGDGVGSSVAVAPDGTALAVGSINQDETAAHVRSFADNGQPNGENTVSTTEYEYFRSVAWSDQTNLFYVSYNSNGGQDRVIAFDSTAAEVASFGVTAGSTETTLRGLAVGEDAIYVVGYWDDNPDSDGLDTGFVDAYAFDGTFQWRFESAGAEGLDAFFLDVAVDDEGSVVVVGFQDAMGAQGQILAQPVAHKLDPEDGTERWSTVVETEAGDVGSLQGVTIGPGNLIVAVGSSGPADAESGPAVFAINP